jgi:hypothetical protein
VTLRKARRKRKAAISEPLTPIDPHQVRKVRLARLSPIAYWPRELDTFLE